MSRTGWRAARSSAQALPSRATPTVRWDNGSAATAPGLRPLGGRADRDNRVEQLAQPVLRPARRGDPRAQLGHQVLEVQGLRTRPGRRDQRDLAL